MKYKEANLKNSLNWKKAHWKIQYFLSNFIDFSTEKSFINSYKEKQAKIQNLKKNLVFRGNFDLSFALNKFYEQNEFFFSFFRDFFNKEEIFNFNGNYIVSNEKLEKYVKKVEDFLIYSMENNQFFFFKDILLPIHLSLFFVRNAMLLTINRSNKEDSQRKNLCLINNNIEEKIQSNFNNDLLDLSLENLVENLKILKNRNHCKNKTENIGNFAKKILHFLNSKNKKNTNIQYIF